MAKEILIAFGIDVDAVAGWLGSYGGEDSPDDISRGLFAGEVGSMRLLKLFEREKLKTTWFIPGHSIETFPEQMQQVADAGHEIGVHGWEHRYLTLRGPRATLDDIRRATELIEGAAGRRPRLFRPPYGVLTGGALAAARRLGLTPVLWGAWGREWVPGATPASVSASLAAGLHGGATVLLHDSDCTSPPGSARAALGALPRLLDACRDQGLDVGPLGQHGWSGAPGPGHHG